MWGWFDRERLHFNFGGGGGGNSADVAADEAAANARLSRLQSQTMGLNIDFMSGQLVNNLQRFDQISRTTQGSSALALARSGGMTSRRTTRTLTTEELGIEYNAVDAVEHLRVSMAETNEQLVEQRNTISGYDTRISDLDSQMAGIEQEMKDLIGTKEETYTERVAEWGTEVVNEETGKTRRVVTGYRKEKKTRDVEYITDQDKYNELSAQKAQLLDEQNGLRNEREEYIGGLERTAEELQEEIDWLDAQITKLGEVRDDVLAEAGEGTVDLQQLTFARGSTISTISRGLENIKDQRDQMFSSGMTGILSMVQQQVAADEQAQISADQSEQYMQLADQMRQAENINMLFQGLGLIGGLALSPIMGPAAGISVGGAAGSFLGNVFSSRV